MNFHMVTNRIISVCVDKEEHDRVMEVLDMFNPENKNKDKGLDGYWGPTRLEGVMFVQSIFETAHMINLESFVDLEIEYPKNYNKKE